MTTKIMNATDAKMTDGQIENAVNKLRDAMRKHRPEISSDVAQLVLGLENLGMILFTPFRERAEALSNLIVCKVKVNRSRSSQKALDATGCVQENVSRVVVDSMPQGLGEAVEIVFFKPALWERTSQSYISDIDLEKAFERRNLKNDPIGVIAANEVDSALVYEVPHIAPWKDASGNWNYVAFRSFRSVRYVDVDYGRDGFSTHKHFAGVRK